MAQQSARRDQENQGFPPCLEHALGDLDRIRELPYRPETVRRLTTGRTDGSIRLRVRNSEIHPCAEGGVHRWEADIASKRLMPHRPSMSIASLPLAVLAIVGLLSVAQPVLADDQTLVCPLRWGEPGRALVTTPETAKAIFLAVEADFFPTADRERFPEIVAEDEGEWWSVFRYRPVELQPDGSMIRTFGGGQLSLRIAKCDARISEVWRMR